MKTTHITCHHCKRRSFLEDPVVVRCPYCGSKQIETKIEANGADTALAVMGFNKLSEEQKAIVLSTEGINYVEAGPGTAKSTTLVARARYLTHYRWNGTQVPLILTFTNQAVEHLEHSFLNEKPELRPHVTTLHSLAYRMLGEIDFWMPDEFYHFSIMDENDWNMFFEKYGAGYSAADGKLSRAAVRQEIQRIKRTSRYVGDLLQETKSDDPVLAPLLAYQLENGLLDFDDLIHVNVWLMKYEDAPLPSFVQGYEYILVDESQDLTAAELELLDLITAYRRNLFLVGDSDQSIYGWRGADNRVCEWLNTLDCEVHRFSLTDNYRSSQAILNAAAKVIEPSPNRKAKILRAVHPEGVKVMVKECPDPFHEARIIASSIELATDPLSQPRPLNYGDIAVLARNHASLHLIRSALIKKKIPVSLDSETPLFQTPAIRSAMQYLRFVANPNYWTLSALDEAMVPEEVAGDFWKEMNAADGLVSTALNRWRKQGKPMTERGSWILNILNDAYDPYRVFLPNHLSNTLESVLTLLAAPETDREIRAFRKVCEPLLKKSGGKMHVFMDLLTLASREETEYCENRNYVHLLTLHGSKGRQFKKVFIAGVTASIIPNPKGDLEEERRLLYVGITRAMKELVVSYYRSSFGHAEGPSPFLADMLRSPSVIFCPVEDYKKRKKKV